MKQMLKIGWLTSISLGLMACQPVEEAQLDKQVNENIPQTISTSKTSRSDHSFFPVKKCMNIGNALEAEDEGAWGYVIEKRHINEVARAGFDTIRLPVRWDLKSLDRPPYTIEPALIARVKEVLDWAHEAGLQVVLDLHHYRDLSPHTRREADKFLGIWAQISKAFSDQPDTVYFELFNEPTHEANMRDVNRLYAQAMPLVRAHNPKRPVIIGGNRWNSVDTLSDVIWPDDPYMVATFHDYGPHDFTHQGANWEDNPPPLGRKWGSVEDKAELKETYDIATAFKNKTDLPVFVGEFGVIDFVPIAERAKWIKARRQAMEAAGFSWCAWDLVARFNYYDKDTNEWLPGMKDALGIE